MPQNNSSQTPPKVMTWSKASLVLIFAGVFDLLRAFFNLFWFFGPAIAALYCSSTASGWVGSMWGLTEVACTTAAGVAGFYFSPIIASFGVIMADAVALLGYLVLTGLVLSTNSRIIKTIQTAIMQIGASFGVAALPLIGAIPTFSIILYKLYRQQIKLEKAAYKKWEKAHASEQVEQRQERVAQFVQSQQNQAEQQQMPNDEVSTENESEKELPREVPDEEETYEPPTAQGISRPSIIPNYTGTNETSQSSPQKSLRGRTVSIEHKKVDPATRKTRPAEGTYRPAPARIIPQLTSVPNYTGTNETSQSSPQKSLVVRSGQTYEQGMERLQKDVLSTKSEHTEVFVVKKDGASSWLKVPENEKNTSPAVESASGEFIRGVANDDTVERFDIVHVRPFQGISPDSNQATRTQKKETVSFSTPPGINDLMGMVTGDRKTSHRPGTIVIDPTGVWKAELVGDPKILLSAKQNPQVSEKPTMSDFASKIKMISGQNITLETDEKLKELQDIYSGIGVNLTFTPHLKEGGGEIPEEVHEAM